MASRIATLFWKIIDDGTIVGSFSQTPFLFHPDRGLYYCQTPTLGDCVSIQDATESSAFVGVWGSPVSGGFNNISLLYSYSGQIIESFGDYTYANGINNNLEVVGAAVSSSSTFTTARIFRGYNPGPLVDRLVPLPNDPNHTLPATVTGLRQACDVNNLGQITVQATSTLSRFLGFVANPVDTPGLALSLGQLGSNPTYIGSIPPALNVTFTDPAGVAYTGGTVALSYSSQAGHLGLSLPPGVTGNYRVYMRCNPTAMPDYTGPIFLNRLYPPLNEPAVPRDAFYLPYDSGTTFNNEPILEMFAGDCDGSGEIDAADIDLVISTFGLVNGDNGFGPTDVDGSGEIDAAEIDLVIANFGLAGDPEP